MARKTAKPSVNFNDEAVKSILSALLAEFRQKGLGASDLQHTYQGLAPAELKKNGLAEGISEVDFDLAMKTLADADLVDTGPMEPFPNDPRSLVVSFRFYSKNEYSYLTEDGYRAATKISAAKPPRLATSQVHITGSTFHGSQIGIGGSVSQTGDFSVASPEQMFNQLRIQIEKLVSDEQKRADVLARLSQLEAAADKPSRIERYNQFVGAIGDHITVLGFMLPPLLYWMMT